MPVNTEAMWQEVIKAIIDLGKKLEALEKGATPAATQPPPTPRPPVPPIQPRPAPIPPDQRPIPVARRPMPSRT
jgi:hypothetical protein